MPCQTVCIFLLFVVIGGIIPHYWFPVHYRWFLWLLTGLNLAVGVDLFFRMPESPRWLEARERRDQARRVVERMEARVMKRHPVLPEPDLTPYEVVAEEKTSWWAPFGRRYVVVTVFLLVVMVLGYGGLMYGGPSQVVLFLRQPRLQRRVHLRPERLGRRGRHRRLPAQRLLRRPVRAQIHPARRRHPVRRRLLGHLPGARHRGVYAFYSLR